jgi:hypothetical protein
MSLPWLILPGQGSACHRRADLAGRDGHRALQTFLTTRVRSALLSRFASTTLVVRSGWPAYYDALRDRDISYTAALRQLGNRLVGILHGCLKTHTLYDETTAWTQHTEQEAA